MNRGVPHKCTKRVGWYVLRGRPNLADKSDATQFPLAYQVLQAPSLCYPPTRRPAYKVDWNSTFSFPSFRLSIKSAKNGASSEGGFLMWVPVSQDWNKACQLIPGLPAQKSCSSPLPKAVLCSHSLLSLPLWVPQEPGRHRDFLEKLHRAVLPS